MNASIRQFDLCVIGGGAAGLSVASGAAQLGLSTVLYEAGEMGGDCLNHGCVPSKALIAAAKIAQAQRDGAAFGVAAREPQVDWPQVQAHIRSVIETIAPADSQARFEGLGVTVIRERARFVDRRTVESASGLVRAKRFVVATGSMPAVPDLPGLDQVLYHTNETIFGIETFPESLLILGAGPVGVELGQAFARLGSKVTVVDAGRALSRIDAECASAALDALRREGVTIIENAAPLSVSARLQGGVAVRLRAAGGERVVTGSDLLFAIGRKPAIKGLGLDAAGVHADEGHIGADPYLRTDNPAIYVAGDVAGRELLTHAAGWHASALVRTLLFKARTATDSQAMPQAVYCDPEIAQIGLTEAQAKERFGGKVSITRWAFAENDRAQTERKTEGFAKIVVGPRARILGAAIFGEGAGDLIQTIGLAMASKLPLRALTTPIAPYPTRGEIWKRAASQFYAPFLFSERTRKLVRLLKALP